MDASSSPVVYVPDDFYCPISGDLMTDHVSERQGHTYERCNIIRWLQEKKSSPMTNLPLHESDLFDNLGLKKSIESIRAKLSEEQFKIDSRISEEELQPFIDTLDQITISTYYNDNKLMVSINPPEVVTRAPVDICLCIDVSGSMGSEATLKGGAGESISNGISILSLTIVAAKTIIQSLNENDNVSVVTYTDKAKIIVENMSCSDTNKDVINLQLNQLRPLNSTNIWDGIHKSFEILKNTSPTGKQKGIILLTDGVPNVVPPQGHEHMIEKYQRTNNFRCPINCYGFGYSLDSPLLDNISKCTGGDGYAFIPDSSLLGNMFIHGISNLLTSAVMNSELHITLKRDVYFKDGMQSKQVLINSLKYGQSKDLLFDIEGYDDYNDFASVSLHMGDKVISEEEVKVPDISYYNDI